jgi:hypothetical protein
MAPIANAANATPIRLLALWRPNARYTGRYVK